MAVVAAAAFRARWRMLLAIAVVCDGVQPLTAAACRDVAGKPRMHGWTRSAQSTVEWLQACVNSDCLFASRAKFSSSPLRLLLASISTTLARTRNDTPCFEPSEGVSRGAYCCASNNPKIWEKAWLCLARPAHSARDSVTDNLLRVNTAHSFLLHGGSE